MALSKGEDSSKHETVLAPGAGRFINVIGDHQTVKLTGEQTGGMFAMAEQNNEAGTAVPLHVHTQEDEMFYVCDGEMTFTVGDKEIVGTTGTTVYLPRGVPHGFRVNKKTRALVSVYPRGSGSHVLPIGRIATGAAGLRKSEGNLRRVRHLF